MALCLILIVTIHGEDVAECPAGDDADNKGGEALEEHPEDGNGYDSNRIVC